MNSEGGQARRALLCILRAVWSPHPDFQPISSDSFMCGILKCCPAASLMPFVTAQHVRWASCPVGLFQRLSPPRVSCRLMSERGAVHYSGLDIPALPDYFQQAATTASAGESRRIPGMSHIKVCVLMLKMQSACGFPSLDILSLCGLLSVPVSLRRGFAGTQGSSPFLRKNYCARTKHPDCTHPGRQQRSLVPSELKSGSVVDV